MTAKFYIYRNLQKPGFFSIKHKGKVEQHADYILCKTASLRVSQAGNKRARENKQRNVHAFVVAESFITPHHSMLYSHHRDTDKKREITYNPFLHTSFVYKDNQEPVLDACNILLLHGKMYELLDK